jgi:splicing factor U2AF subunit
MNSLLNEKIKCKECIIEPLFDYIPPPPPENDASEHPPTLKESDQRKSIERSVGRDNFREKHDKKRPRIPSLTPPRLRLKRESGWDIFPHQLIEYQERNPGTIMSPHLTNCTAGTSTSGPVSQKTRHARRSYIGNLPDGCTDNEIRDFFTGSLTAIGGVTMPGEPVLSIYINRDKKFAFVEFRSVEECSNCMALEGILWRGSQLRVRRPNDYDPSEAVSLGPTTPNSNLNLSAIGLGNTAINNSYDCDKEDVNDRVFIGGLPHFLTEEQVLDILRPFGEIKTFDLARDRSNGKSKGYGFCAFTDQSVTDVACKALNGFKLGERSLTVKRALAGQLEQQKSASEQIQRQQQQAMEILADMQKKELQEMGRPTCFLILIDCISPSELGDKEEFKDIFDDMREMFVKYGLVRNIRIPLPDEKGCGKVIVEYDNVSQAATARHAIHGKPFSGKPVIAQFLTATDFATENY